MKFVDDDDDDDDDAGLHISMSSGYDLCHPG